MLNVSYDIGEGSHDILLAVMFPEKSTATVEDEFFPLVEEIIPRNPENRSDFHRSPDTAPGTFLSIMAPN